MKRCTECHVPLPRDHKGPNLCAGCRLEAEDAGLFFRPLQADLTVDRDMARLAWREKIRAKTKPIDELPLFRRQKEMF